MPTIHGERQGRIAVFTMEGDVDLDLEVVEHVEGSERWPRRVVTSR